jgi:hypothetical protein
MEKLNGKPVYTARTLENIHGRAETLMAAFGQDFAERLRAQLPAFFTSCFGSATARGVLIPGPGGRLFPMRDPSKF